MSAPTPCPARATLEALLASDHTDPEEARVVEHLGSCGPCQQLLTILAAGAGDALPDCAPVERSVPGHALERVMRLLKAEAADVVTEAADSAACWLDGETPAPGSQLGPYEVHEVIGRGGMGVVLKAFDPALQRLVAIKVLAAHLAANPAARRRFAREARAAAAVRHEHVVTIHGVNEAGGEPYLVMEYVAGPSLQDYLDRKGPLEPREVLHIGLQLASGLAAAHAQGLVHRDVKPANILLVDGVEHVKLTDFGLARTVDDASLTQSGLLAGTPSYMAPEQARGESLDPRADLFSLGSVLYALCTGRSPFGGGPTLAVLRRVCENTPRPITDLNPEVPPFLAAVINTLHAKDREQRFGSAEEVVRILGRYLVHLEQPDRFAEPPLPAPVPPRRRLFLAGVLLGILALTLAAAAFHPALFSWLHRGDRTPPVAEQPAHAPKSLQRPAVGIPKESETRLRWITSVPTTVDTWGMGMEAPRPVGTRSAGPIIGVSLSPDGRTLTTTGPDGSVQRWARTSSARGEELLP